jgi:hypothetical protein
VGLCHCSVIFFFFTAIVEIRQNDCIVRKYRLELQCKFGIPGHGPLVSAFGSTCVAVTSSCWSLCTSNTDYFVCRFRVFLRSSGSGTGSTQPCEDN